MEKFEITGGVQYPGQSPKAADLPPATLTLPDGGCYGTDAVNAKPAHDNWTHRAEGMKCQSCMWFVWKSAPGIYPILGRCRKHAPTLQGWPAVYGDDWCGDHKLDETKI